MKNKTYRQYSCKDDTGGNEPYTRKTFGFPKNTKCSFFAGHKPYDNIAYAVHKLEKSATFLASRAYAL